VYLTTYALEGAFDRSTDSAFNAARPANDFALFYFEQALQNANRSIDTECIRTAGRAATDRLVVADCDPAGKAECPPLGNDELAASELACDGFDDVSAALIGMHPRRTWLTRLELELPRQALAMDCVVEPNFDQTTVSNTLQAVRIENPPCEQAVFSSSLSPTLPRSLGLIALGAVLFGIVLRRALASTT
jgi:hypothetical protein